MRSVSALQALQRRRAAVAVKLLGMKCSIWLVQGRVLLRGYIAMQWLGRMTELVKRNGRRLSSA